MARKQQLQRPEALPGAKSAAVARKQQLQRPGQQLQRPGALQERCYGQET